MHSLRDRWQDRFRRILPVGGRPNLPGYDALGPEGAHINLVIDADAAVTGAASHRCYPCEIIRLTG
jgi:hypothetical protein